MKKRLEDLLVIDIETVPMTRDFSSIDGRLKKQWERKAKLIKNDEGLTVEELFSSRAGIYAEFGRVVCISMGFFTLNEGGKWTLRVKSIAEKEEKNVLEGFTNALSKFDEQSTFLCAHNGREFDFPYLCRRLLINGLGLPAQLDNGGKKPWEVNYIDTMDMWKFGDWKSYTSLDLLASVFNVASSKSDMDGSMVATVYYEEDGLKRISEYCEQDVVVTAQVYLCLTGRPVIEEKNIVILS